MSYSFDFVHLLLHVIFIWSAFFFAIGMAAISNEKWLFILTIILSVLVIIGSFGSSINVEYPIKTSEYLISENTCVQFSKEDNYLKIMECKNNLITNTEKIVFSDKTDIINYTKNQKPTKIQITSNNKTNFLGYIGYHDNVSINVNKIEFIY